MAPSPSTTKAEGTSSGRGCAGCFLALFIVPVALVLVMLLGSLAVLEYRLAFWSPVTAQVLEVSIISVAGGTSARPSVVFGCQYTFGYQYGGQGYESQGKSRTFGPLESAEAEAAAARKASRRTILVNPAKPSEIEVATTRGAHYFIMLVFALICSAILAVPIRLKVISKKILKAGRQIAADLEAARDRAVAEQSTIEVRIASDPCGYTVARIAPSGETLVNLRLPDGVVFLGRACSPRFDATGRADPFGEIRVGRGWGISRTIEVLPSGEVRLKNEAGLVAVPARAAT